jgi:imidazolonepropionase-like amidohydrolase
MSHFRTIVGAWALGASALGAQSGVTRAYTGFTLIDGTGRAPVKNAAMVVRDGRIVAAGAARSISIPAGAERVPLDSMYVIPGLINAHGHVNTPADLQTYADYGVTTVFSLGGEPPSVFAARAEQNVPTLARARVYLAGPVLAPRTVDEARAMVDSVVAMKTDIVKIRVDDNLGTTQKMPPEIYRAVIDQAHKRGMRVATHLFYLADAEALLAAGSDFVAHSIRDADVDAAVIAQFKTRNVCLSPTLMREVSTFVYEERTPWFFADSLFDQYANHAWVDTLLMPARQAAVRANPAAQRYKVALVQANKNLKKLSDAGVGIAMGTDTGPMGRFQGYFELLEIEMMADAGLTPAQALDAATRGAARCMKLDRDLGTLEAGKWADFVVLDSDPLMAIHNVRRISSVWIAGNKVAR